MKNKKTVKNSISHLIAVILIAVTLPIVGTSASDVTSGACGENLSWSFDFTTRILTVSGTGAMEDYSTETTPPWYSENEYIEKIIIENGVTYIGNRAFTRCSNLTSVIIPSTLTAIGENAFLRSDNLLNGVYINDLFAWCNISFGNQNSNPLCYANNIYLNNEPITELVIPDGIAKINNFAFYAGKCLQSVVIGHDVTEIGNYAFANCTNITSAIIPYTVNTINNKAFYGCKGINLTVQQGSYAHSFAVDNNIEYTLCTHLSTELIGQALPTYIEAGNNCYRCTLCGAKSNTRINPLCDFNNDTEVNAGDYLEFESNISNEEYLFYFDFDNGGTISEFDKIIVKQLTNKIEFSSMIDANTDGYGNIIDLIKIKKTVMNSEQNLNCDCNLDTRVDAQDMVFVKKFLLVMDRDLYR